VFESMWRVPVIVTIRWGCKYQIHW